MSIPSTPLPDQSNAARASSFIDELGPGLITGAADDDPSGIATYSQAGAQFGFGMLWTMLLTYPLMTAVQLVSAEIGRVTGCGLAQNLKQALPRPVVFALVAMLFVANTINIGADLAAMGAAAQLVLGGWQQIYTVVFAIVSLLLQVFVPYSSYARYLKWLTLVLLSYVAVLFVVPIDWKAAASGFVWPNFPLNAASFTLIVAIIGTTISPYMFFWQSAQEVEEIHGHRAAKPLLRAPDQAGPQLRRIKIDTFFGMAVSNVVAVAIMVSTAATLHAAGKTEIGTAADAAEALRPIAGNFAFLLFSLGIVGTGLLAIPVLAGSAAYAIGETEGWKCGLENKPWKAIGFYGIITASTLAGIVIACSSLDPIQALLWSAVINGFAAVPIMVGMMYVAGRRDQMGRFTIGAVTRVFGWLAMAATALAAITMVIANIGLERG